MKITRLMSLFAASVAVAFAVACSGGGGPGLKVGEYACYGSSGPLIGLGFKVLDNSNYNDLDGKSPGTYSIDGDRVIFHGGHLDGQTGVDLKDDKFNLSGHGVSCEPWK
ncbi:MAG: hypothetical protein JO348_10015 [Alphaproteobacteria bacterium]|nr:hypothetical protein [Alphaproteobacteria bacterium]MBV9420095.1 hypothetical protein [Alphaproteobacteria bacterium]MBV9903042.1 hypothetical protein [Alphaproteobacteria bacterium]